MHQSAESQELQVMRSGGRKQKFVELSSGKLAALVVLFLLSNCFVTLKSFATEQLFLSITPIEARDMLVSRKDILFVDVRTAREVADTAVEGAQPIPMSAILKGQVVLPKDKPIILICAVGGRSYWVGRFLSHQGYPEVYNLKGGIVAWEQAGLAVEKK